MSSRDIHVHLTISLRALAWYAAILLVICCALEVGSESLTMTTYYPAPSGIYKRLAATDRAAIGTYKPQDAPSESLIISGRVGIGTAAPGNRLSVSGDADFSGQVGIGIAAPAAKLDVAGGIRVGDVSACDAGTGGTLRYNSTAKQMEFCNGASWEGFGAGASVGAGAPCDAGGTPGTGLTIYRTTGTRFCCRANMTTLDYGLTGAKNYTLFCAPF